MADQNDLNKPDLTSNYSNEVLETIRGHIARLWKGDYTGMGNLVSGLRRWVKVGTADAKLVERDSAGAETTIVDTSLLARATGSNASGTWGVNINNTATTTRSLQVNGNTTVTGNLGVGTSSPTFRLVAAGSSTDGVGIGSVNTYSFITLGGYSLATDGAAQIGYERSTGNLTFGTGSRDVLTERIRIIGGQIQTCFDGTSTLADASFIRAWAKFNMQSGSGSLAFTGRGISSVVKNADNSLTINFSNPMPDANYAILQGPAVYNYSSFMQMDGTPVFGTTSFRINCINGSNQVVTPTFVSFAVVR